MLQVLTARGVPALALVRDLRSWQQMEWPAALSVTPVQAPVAEPERRGTTGVRSLDAPPPDAHAEVARLAASLPQRPAGVIHLAALVRHSRENAAEVYRTNIEGTLTMVRLAAGLRCRMIHLSTSGVVGCFSSPGSAADEDAAYCWDVIESWPYYHSKAVAERRARQLAAELGVELVIVRPPVLLGPGDHRARSTSHLIRYLRGRLPFLVAGGMHFADVRDAAAAIVRALEHPRPRPVYHLTGSICSIREFFALAEEVSGVSAPRRTVPAAVARRLAAVLRPLGVLPDPVVIEAATHHWGTTSRFAESDLGYRSREPRETMRDTIQWLRLNHPGL